MSATFFELATLRLMLELSVTRDKQVAAALGLSRTSFAERKKRGAFPEMHLRAAAQKHSEWAIDVAYVLTGIKTVSPASGATERQSHTDGQSTQAPSGGHPDYVPDAAMEMARERRVATAVQRRKTQIDQALGEMKGGAA